MTTLALTGYRIIDRAGGANDSLARVSVNLGVNDGYRLRYGVTETNSGIHSIALDETAGRLHAVTVNGASLAEGYEAFVIFPTARGKTSTFLVFARDMAETTDDLTDLEMTYVQIGGAAAPKFKKMAAFNKWFQARDLLDSPPAGATAPGQSIDLTKSSAFVRTLHADQFQLLPNWGGRLVETGVLDDVVAGNDLGNAINLGLGNDRGDGAMGNDTLLGDAGNDRLLGGRGGDFLDGGIGNDTLVGGWGSDTLTGGLGADRFVFDDIRGNDIVTDFEDGIDKLNLQTFGFNATTVSAAMTQEGADVHILLAADTLLVVQNMTVSALQDDLIL